MDKLASLGNEFSKIILDKFDGIAYIVDIDTYDFVYINKHFRELLNITDDSYLEKKCYQVLQGLSEPCDFCINSQLKAHQAHGWQIHKQILERPFEAQVSLIEWQGKNYRIEYGVDFNEYQHNMEELQNKISTEELLINCADTLCRLDDIENAFKIILENVVEFFEADRSYLYEYSKKTTKLQCTLFFVRPFVSSFKEILSETDEKILQLWLKSFSDKSKVYLQNVQIDLLHVPELQKAFEEKNIQNMLIIPFYNNKEFAGLIGVDNPRYNIENLQILSSISLFILTHLQQRRLLTRLNYLSNIDELTGSYNRNKYLELLETIKTNKENVGVLYVDLNGLKKINDLQGHEKGDEFIVNACNFLQQFFGKNVYRIGGDEFVVLLRGVPQKAFDELYTKFVNKLNAQQGHHYDMSYGEQYCENGTIEESIKHADEMMFQRKRVYYQTNEKYR
jgi:diguanylate cyclase (GGDEF)-like protein